MSKKNKELSEIVESKSLFTGDKNEKYYVKKVEKLLILYLMMFLLNINLFLAVEFNLLL